jgi:TonB family protein
MVVFISACLWAQQGQTPDSHDAATANGSQDSSSAFSDADKSLACPAGLAADDQRVRSDEPGEGVKPPKALKQVNAEFSDEARKMFAKAHLKFFYAFSLLHLIVDKDGNPQDICVQKAAGYGLDGEAVKAAKQYRFKPARNPDGSPVPVAITIQVDFRLYR